MTEKIHKSHNFLIAFGKKVRELRKKANLSQEELAYVCNLHRTYIGSVERGERNVTIITIATIALALDVEPATLIPHSVEFVRKKE